MRSPPRILLLAAVLALAAVAALGISAIPGRGPLPTASPAALVGIAAENLPPPDSAIPPGRYTVQDFLPRLTFELEHDGWWTSQRGQGLIALRHDAGMQGELGLTFARPTGVYSAGSKPVAVTTSEEAARAIGFIDIARVVGSSDSRMDGQTGKVVEVEYDAASDTSIAVLQLPGENNGIPVGPGRRLWVALLDTRDGLLAIVVDVSIDNVERDLAVMEPILESVTIGR